MQLNAAPSKVGEGSDGALRAVFSRLIQATEPMGGSWLWQSGPFAPLWALGSSGFPPELPAWMGLMCAPAGRQWSPQELFWSLKHSKEHSPQQSRYSCSSKFQSKQTYGLYKPKHGCEYICVRATHRVIGYHTPEDLAATFKPGSFTC